MNNAEQLQQLEVSLDQAKEAVALKQAVLDLSKNKNFKKVVNDGYFKEEAARLVLIKSDDNMQEEDKQKSIGRQIDAVGTFRQYLATQIALGNMAERAIEADENTREEILEEDLSE